jgi:hypothetical protein
LVSEVGDQVPVEKFGQKRPGVAIKNRFNRCHGIQIHLGAQSMRSKLAKKGMQALHVYVANHAVTSLHQTLLSAGSIANQFLAV